MNWLFGFWDVDKPEKSLMYARRGFLRLDLNIHSPTTAAPDPMQASTIKVFKLRWLSSIKSTLRETRSNTFIFPVSMCQKTTEVIIACEQVASSVLSGYWCCSTQWIESCGSNSNIKAGQGRHALQEMANSLKDDKSRVSVCDANFGVPNLTCLLLKFDSWESSPNKFYRWRLNSCIDDKLSTLTFETSFTRRQNYRSCNFHEESHHLKN